MWISILKRNSGDEEHEEEDADSEEEAPVRRIGDLDERASVGGRQTFLIKGSSIQGFIGPF